MAAPGKLERPKALAAGRPRVPRQRGSAAGGPWARGERRAVPGSRPPHARRRDASTVRVLLLGDQLLTREALRTAMTSRGVEVLEQAIPHARQELRVLVHEAEAFGADVGALVLERFDPWVVGDCQRLMRGGPAMNWMVITACDPGPYWSALLLGGAEDVLSLDIGIDALMRALPAVADGEQVMDPVDRVLLERRNAEECSVLERLASLSPREVQVLTYLARGQNVAEVALSQEVSEETVRSHVQAILRKLQVSSQLTAVAQWTQANQGWPSSRGL